MSEIPPYEIRDVLSKNEDIKQILSEAILDLKYLSEEFADHLLTGEHVINTLSAIVLDLEEAHDDMIVMKDDEKDSDNYRMGSWGKGKDE